MQQHYFEKCEISEETMLQKQKYQHFFALFFFNLSNAFNSDISEISKNCKNILVELNIYNLKENINIEKIKELKLSITVDRFLFYYLKF